LCVSLATCCRARSPNEKYGGKEKLTSSERHRCLALLDRLPFCSTVRTLVKVFIIKTAAVGTPYLDNFTYDLFLPDHLWTFRENLVFNSAEPEHSPKPKDKRDNNQDGHYHKEDPEQGKHRIERRKRVYFHTIIGYTGHI
jgi:hypothetical protein